MIPDMWDMWSLRLVVTLGLVLAGFLPLAYSVWSTYQAEDNQSEKHHE